MTTHMLNKNVKYLPTKDRNRYYALHNIAANRRSDSDLEELGDLDAKADRIAERENPAHNKRDWEG